MNDLFIRAKQLGEYIILKKCTIRETAKAFNMAKSTVHYDVSVRLKKYSPNLYKKVKQILDYNFKDKHNRGGIATKKMYESKKKGR